VVSVITQDPDGTRRLIPATNLEPIDFVLDGSLLPLADPRQLAELEQFRQEQGITD
jgi:hypothetical protein